jgi:hypothetical protein
VIHDLRNPYGILGLPFGASGDQASRAFARRARGLRHQADGTEKLTQLTWALNQIQEAIKDPRTALHIYRIPADPGALESRERGVLNPPPERMDRTTGPSDDDWVALLDAARSEARRALVADVLAQASLPAR